MEGGFAIFCGILGIITLFLRNDILLIAVRQFTGFYSYTSKFLVLLVLLFGVTIYIIVEFVEESNLPALYATGVLTIVLVT